MKKLLLLSTLIIWGHCTIVNAGLLIDTFVDKRDEVVILEQIDCCDIECDLAEQRDVFNEAFWAARVFSGLAVAEDSVAKETFLKIISSSMDEVKSLLASSDSKTFGVSARKEGVVIGFLIFSQEADGIVYVNQGAVHPGFWCHGIMTHLIKKIVYFLPATKKIVFVARKTNKVAGNCYAHIAEKVPELTRSDYVRAGYDPAIYQGYECVLSPAVLGFLK